MKETKGSGISTGFWLFRKLIDPGALTRDSSGLRLNPSARHLKCSIFLVTHVSSIAIAVTLRKKYKIDKPYIYPFIIGKSIFDVKKLNSIDAQFLLTSHLMQSLDESIGEKNRVELSIEVKAFLEAIGFDSNFWLIPYLCWVVCAMMPVPPRIEPISFYEANQAKLQENEKYPTLIIRSTTTQLQIRQFLATRLSVKKKIYSYPNHFDFESLTDFAIGAWIIRKKDVEKVGSWEKIEEQLDSFSELFINNDSDDKNVSTEIFNIKKLDLERISLSELENKTRRYFSRVMPFYPICHY
jgi:hypothetical protein